MADSKIYTIKIDGITQAIDNTSTLGESLDRLSKTVESNGDSFKKTSSSMDELGKVTQKITNFDNEYQIALQSSKNVLSDLRSEIKQNLDLENAQMIVNQNSMSTYNEKQQLLTALGKVIRATNTDTEEGQQKVEELTKRYKAVNDQLKSFDETMGNHQRNVGGYKEALSGMRNEIKEIEGQLASMLANGVSKTDEQFKALAERAGVLRDAMNDAREEINRFASDTKKIDDVINVAQSATAAFELYKGTMSAFGIEVKGAVEAIQQLQGAMAIIQSLQTLSNTLQNGSATAKLMNIAMKELGVTAIQSQISLAKTALAQEGLTVAQKAGIIASNALKVAMMGIPLMLIIGLVATLITHWEGINKAITDLFPVFKKFGGFTTTMKTAIIGVGKAIIQWMINPWETLAKVMMKVFAGDFTGALEELKKGVVKQFTGMADAFKGAFNDAAEEVTAKQAEEDNKQLDHHIAMLEAKGGKDAKYTKEYQDLVTKRYENEKKMAKGNAEQLKKIEQERELYLANLDRERTEKEKQEHDKRVKIAQKAANDRKKAEEDAAKKAQEEWKKRLDDAAQSFQNFYSSKSKFRESQSEEAFTILPKVNVEIADGNITINGWDKIAILLNRLINKVADEKQEALELNPKVNTQKWDNLLSYYGDLYSKIVQLDGAAKKGVISAEELQNILGGSIPIDENGIPKFKEYVSEATVDIRNILLELIDFSAEEKKFNDEFNKHISTWQKYRSEVGQTAESYDDFIEKMELLSKLQESLEESHPTDEKGKAIDTDEILHETIEGSELFKNVPADKIQTVISLLYEYRTTLNETDKAIIEDAEYQRMLGDTVDGLSKKIADYNAEIDDTLGYLQYTFDSFDTRKFESAIGRALNAKEYKKYLEEMGNAWSFVYVDITDKIEKLQNLWDAKLQTIAEQYGTNSEQYIKAVQEMEKEIQKLIGLQEEAAKKMPGGESSGGTTLGGDSLAPGDKKKSRFSDKDGNTDWSEFVKGNLEEVTSKVLNTFMDNMFDPIADAFSTLLEFEIEEAQEALDKATKMHDKSVKQVEASQSRLKELNEEMRNANGAQLESLKQKTADEMMLLAQREAEEKRLAKEKEKREKELEKKQKEKQKLDLKRQLVEATVNTAVAATKAYAQYGWPLGAVFAAIITAMGLMQVATITKQISKLADGGLIQGKSHAQGGVPVGNTGIEVEGGEFVVNKRSTKMYMPLLEAINNQGRRGKAINATMNKYANGGELNYNKIDSNLSGFDTNKVIQNSIGGIDLHPVVSVVDIARGVNNLSTVRQYAGAGSALRR